MRRLGSSRRLSDGDGRSVLDRCDVLVGEEDALHPEAPVVRHSTLRDAVPQGRDGVTEDRRGFGEAVLASCHAEDRPLARPFGNQVRR